MLVNIRKNDVLRGSGFQKVRILANETPKSKIRFYKIIFLDPIGVCYRILPSGAKYYENPRQPKATTVFEIIFGFSTSPA